MNEYDFWNTVLFKCERNAVKGIFMTMYVLQNTPSSFYRGTMKF